MIQLVIGVVGIIIIIAIVIFTIYVIRESPPEIHSPWDWEGYQKREEWEKKHKEKR